MLQLAHGSPIPMTRALWDHEPQNTAVDFQARQFEIHGERPRLFGRALGPGTNESAGKPDALQTLRDIRVHRLDAPAFGVREACSRVWPTVHGKQGRSRSW